MVAETDDIVVFKDIHPKAPTHWLLVPRKHVVSINDFTDNERFLAGELILLARRLAQEHGFDARGYKLMFNVGRGGGQMVDHVHLHLLSGWSEHPKEFAV